MMIRYDSVVLDVMGATTSEHEIVHAHSDVFSVCLDAFVDKHTRTFYAVHGTWFWFYVS